MYARALLAALLVSILAVSANASIMSWTSQSDGDGALVCNPRTYAWEGGDTMNVYGDHVRMSPGHVLGEITTDTALDPSILLGNSIDNDTGVAWRAYHVNVIMSNPFTITPGSVILSSPSDWTAALTSQPVLVGSNYVGQLDFTGPSALPAGGTLDFQYRIFFSGQTQYSYTQEMIPAAVPEPASLGVLAIGAIGLLTRRRH